jgi:RNA-directed DNA polymerase
MTNEAAPLWNLDDFARQIGISAVELMNARLPEIRKYHEVIIPKHSDGFRTLRIPSPPMMRLQRLMHRRVFRHVPVSAAVHGSVSGRSNVTHARVHKNAKAVYILDLADAFTQATPQRIIESMSGFNMTPGAKGFVAELVTFAGSIPQGSPTSNTVWNMVCKKLDAILEKFALCYGLTYTRYTDELTFSHPNHISHEVRDRIKTAVAKAGFIINKKKTRYFHVRHGALSITGVNIANGKIGLSKKAIQKLRGVIHRAALDRSIPWTHVQGLIGYARFVSGGLLPARLRESVDRFRFFRRRPD